MKLDRYRWDKCGKTRGRDNSWGFLWVKHDPNREERWNAFRGLPLYGVNSLGSAILPSIHPFYVVRGKDIQGDCLET